jgi:prophage antirepressor-like protein
MNTQMIIKEFQTKQITMIQDDDKEVWFKGHDVATILGYAKPENAIIRHVDADDKLKLGDISTTLEWGTHKIKKNIVFINESGLYSLILRSKLEGAKQFKRWVTKEVLPSIRKNGTYTMPKIEPLQLRQIQMEEMKMIDMIGDAKLKQAFTDRLMNELQGTDNQEPKEQWSRDIVTIVKEELNTNITSSQAALIGKSVAKKYRIKYNKQPQKYEKFVNGNTRKVFAYTKDEEHDVVEWVHQYYQ